MKGAIVFGRTAAAIVLAVATYHALDRWTVMPLRCARAAWHGAQALDLAEKQRAPVQRRTAMRVRTGLRDCECVPTPELFFTLGYASDMLDDPQSAMAAYRHALVLDRRPEIYFALGLSELAALDRNAAIDHLTTACAFAPARLADIPYDDVRREVSARLLASYGENWLR